ncbi:MAG: hypothetical protein HC897_04645 [Thermoanaerobaculia bacterium]|nr:hypothetical protein [Thermoanaerobaculia bacterium]
MPGEPEPPPAEPTAADLELEPVKETVMPVAPDPLLGFRPGAFFLGEGYEPDRLNVWLDGGPVESKWLKRVELAPGQRGFRFDGLRVDHGAIVRVDFEPVAATSDEPEASPGGGA